jgi:streptogramin lyase
MKLVALLGSLLVLSAQVPAQGKDLQKGKLPAPAGISTPGIQIPFSKLKIEATAALPEEASQLMFARDVLAVAGKQIARIETKANRPLEAWPADAPLCGGMVSAFGHLWAPACDKNAILKLDARTGKVKKLLEVGAHSGALTVAATKDSIWAITDARGTLSRIDPQEDAVVAEIRIPTDCSTLLYASDALWASCPETNRVLRIDDQVNVVKERLETVDAPGALLFGEGTLFVYGQKEGKIAKLDPKTNKVTGKIETLVPGSAASMVLGDGHLWLSQKGFPLTKINTKDEKVVQQFRGEGAGMLLFASESLWLAPAGKKELLRIDPKRVAVTLAD